MRKVYRLELKEVSPDGKESDRVLDVIYLISKEGVYTALAFVSRYREQLQQKPRPLPYLDAENR